MDVTTIRRCDEDGTDAHGPLVGLHRLVNRIGAPVFVFDLVTRRGCFGNAAAASLMGTSGPVLQKLLRMDLGELAGADAADRIEQGLAALTTGAVRSYQAQMTYRACNGEPIHALHTVTRLDMCDAAPVAVGVVSRRPAPDTRPDVGPVPSIAPARVALDHDWRVDAMSPDVEPRLCLGAAELLGSQLFAHVHPEDRADLLQAFERASVEDAVTMTVCLRVGREWRPADLLIGALCGHLPHRLGVLFTVHCDANSASEERCPPVSERLTLGGQQLSQQQQEVVTRLLRGESIATMAAAMHLSRSTVRNHLCAVYAKAGVHSQAELVAHVTGRHLGSTNDRNVDTARSMRRWLW